MSLKENMSDINKTVLVAMSGGVDSSVAALLLKRKGFNVKGITMEFVSDDSGHFHYKDAAKVASVLKIPHITVDASSEFKKLVIDKFCSEYRAGRTPNPCVRCNRYMKFNILKNMAEEQGARFIATGHYARTGYDRITGAYHLKRALNGSKDQSYFLYTLNQEILRKTLFPLGELTKDTVRSIAKDNNLPVFEKDESQEICFIKGKDYRKLFKGCEMPGPITNRKGEILGTHTGIADFTVGQRRGLGIATGKPLYVIEIDPEKNAIVVGNGNEAFHDTLIAEEVNWVVSALRSRIEVMVKIRSLHRASRATLIPLRGGKAELTFFVPQWAITPGQSAVFYDNETVLGGGIIKSASRSKEYVAKRSGSQLST
jgi:tRNA-specific 2-thiouridylase